MRPPKKLFIRKKDLLNAEEEKPAVEEIHMWL